MVPQLLDIALLGSSPRVRSRHVGQVLRRVRRGIISACAEQTPASIIWVTESRDHLRVCGADGSFRHYVI